MQNLFIHFFNNHTEYSHRHAHSNNDSGKCLLSGFVMASKFFVTVIPPDRVTLYKDILQRKSCFVGQCQLWTGHADDNGYGVQYVQFEGKNVKVQAHRLSFYLHGLTQRLSPSIHVSHRCHNQLCIKPCHLSYEPARTNNARKVCKADGECRGHGKFRKCLLGAVMINLHKLTEPLNL